MNTTAQWQALDAAHHLHPFTDAVALQARGVRVITRAQGVWLEDSEGQRILDGMAGLWCVNLGYGRNELAQAAFDQLQTLPYYNTFFKTTHPPAVALAQALAQCAPAGLQRVFFTNSGSEANDTVIRMVRHFWASQGKVHKRILLSRHNAYHGSTMGAASLGGMDYMHAQGGLPIPDIHHIRQPWWYGEAGDESPEAFAHAAAQALERAILQWGPENVAAFVAEPIQGAGGVIVPPEGYWPEVAAICARYQVLLVVDEVICGFGRTGEWFGCQYYGITPDLMVIAKGLSSGYVPIGGVMVHDRVADVLAHGDFNHGFTYSGHPLACAVALENLRLLREEGWVSRVKQVVGPYFQQQLRVLFADHPLVGEVAGVGLLGAVQFVADKKTRRLFNPAGAVGMRCRDYCFAANYIVRAVGDRMVLAPPLVISLAEIDQLLSGLRDCIDQTARDFGYL